MAQEPGQDKQDRQDRFQFTPADQIPIPSDTTEGQALDLRLRDAMSLGLLQSADLQATELSPLKAYYDLQIAKAFFEPEMFSRASVTRAKDPNRNIFEPELKRDIYDLEVGWRQRAVTGGDFDMAFFSQKLNQTSVDPGFPPTQFTAGFRATYTQPLLRNAWSSYALRDVDTARAAQAEARNVYEQDVQDTLLSIVRAYWELVFAREEYRVQYQGYELAQEQLRITRAKIQARALAPRDVVADEAEVARRQEGLITAENEIRLREDDLRRLLFDNRDGEMWVQPLRPTSPIPTKYDVADLRWQVPALEARRHRPDLQALRNEIRIAELGLSTAEIELLPQLDLVSSYNSAGVRPHNPDAWADAFDFEFPDWSVALEFSIPIGNSAAKARLQRARIEVEEKKRNLYVQELDIDREVREAVRNLKTLVESIRAARESVRLAENDLDTARHKQRVGELTFFDVQERNQQLVEARSRLLRNQLDFRIAQAVLLHAQGKLTADGERNTHGEVNADSEENAGGKEQHEDQ